MSKWRPSKEENLYIIPDIHGSLHRLKLICNRIFPLRKSSKDKVIFLGDYIDRHPDSHKVVDYIIELKNKYPNQIICLLGNHEDLILRAIKSSANSSSYRMWMMNGGEFTLSGYLNRAGIKMENPWLFPRERIVDIVPTSHINFFMKLKGYYETDKYIFVHGGCDPYKLLYNQDEQFLCWDRDLINVAKIFSISNEEPPWDKTIVTGHNTSSTFKTPLILDKFMMLDCSAHKRLFIIEINSGEGFFAEKLNKRLIKYNLIKTKFA